MKTYFYIFIISLLSVNSFGQQLGLSNLYSSNLQSINSAYSSMSDYDAVFINHRTQWAAVEDNPVTSFISGNYKLNKNSGLGGNLFLENIGLIRQLYAISSYSRSLRFRNHKFSLGLGIGFHQQSIAFNEIIAEDYSDDIISNNGNTGATLLTELGAMYNYKNLTFGFSTPRIFETKIKSTNFGLERQQIAFGSYNIKYNENINLIPSSMYKFVTLDNSQFDINLDLELKKLFMFGVGYRSNSSILLRANAHVLDKIDVGYSFESNYNSTRGKFISHEIRLAYKIFHPKEELDLKDFESENPAKSDSAFLIYKDENDSILRFRFSNIESLKDYTIEHRVDDYTIEYLVNSKLIENPELKTLNLLLAQDSLYTVEIEDSLGAVKKHRFVTIKELHDFNYKLTRENPILSAKLQKEIDVNPDLHTYHILNSNFDNYEIDIYDSTTLETKRFRFKNIESLNDFLLNIEKEDNKFYKKIISKIFEEPNINIFNVSKENKGIELEIDNNGTTEKFKFKNVKEMNDYILNLNDTDPKLATKLRNEADLNPDYKIIETDNLNPKEIVIDNNGKQERFKFKNVQELNDYILKLDETNPTLASKLRNQIDINPEFNIIEIDHSETVGKEIVIEKNGKKERYKFKNVQELNDYILKLNESDPTLASKLRNQVDVNPHFELFKVDNAVTEEISADIEVAIKNNEATERFKFKNVQELNDFILKLNETDPTLASKIKNQLDINPYFKLLDIDNSDANHKTDITFEELQELCSKITISYEINKSNSDISKYDDNIIELVGKLNDSKYNLLIVGHTCDLKTSEGNYKLGLKRAEGMKNIFVNKGAKTDKVRLKSYGSKNPIVINSSEENRKLNRRVDFIILKEGEEE